MTTTPYRISIGVDINAAGAKTGAAETITHVNEIGAQADRIVPKLDRAINTVEKLGTAAQSDAPANIAAIGAAADSIRPSMDRLINSFANITAPAANRNGRAGDIAAYGQELDRLQAKFDPLFAAQQRYRNQIEEINDAQRVGALSASAAIDARIRETNSLNALTSKLDGLALARKRAAEGVVAGATVSPDRGSDIEAYGRQLDQMRSKYNPVFATLTAYKAQLAEIREAHKVGAITADEMTAAISRQRKSALETVNVLKGRSADGGADRAGQFRRQNLTYQLFDIGQTAAMGMNPAMIFAQQGPQIIQLYTGKNGVNNAIKDLGTIASSTARLMTPLVATVGALAAATALSLIAYNGYLKSTKEVETAASGLGRAVAGTAAEMEASARAGAAAAGISVSSARSMEAQFLRTGRIGSENFEDLISISKDFGATIGQTAEEAAGTLAEMFADPAKAAETLYQQYGLIDAATARHATTLARSNRTSEAQAVLLDALPDRLASAAEATSKLGRAWNYVTTTASNAMNAVGGAIDRAVSGPTLEEQLDEVRRAKETLSSSPMGMLQLLNPAFMLQLGDIDKEKELLDKISQRDAEDLRRQRVAEEVQRSRAVRAVSDASGANAGGIRIETLRNEIATLESGQNLGGRDDVQIKRDEVAMAAKKRVLDALINSQERAIALDNLDIQIANERNPLLRAELEARRVRLEMADQEIDSAKIEAEVNRARNRVIEETIAGAQAYVQDMELEFDVRSRLNALVANGTITSADANRMLQEEIALRPLIAAAAIAEGDAKERLNRIISDMRDSNARLAAQEKEASGQEYLRSQNERLEQLRVEQALIGANDNVRERSLALLRVEQEIKRRGIDTNSNLAKQMREQADAAAVLNRQIEKQADAWDKVKSTAEGTIDGLVDGLIDGDFEDALENVAKDITSMFSELAIKNPLKNALFGSDNATMSDVGGLGGIFSRLFGGGASDPASIVSSAMGQSVGAMSVNAGTVTINGGLAGGLGGLLGGAANDNLVTGSTGTTDMSAYRAAIKAIESAGSGGYSALGPITASGDRAYGAYQVMGANIPAWTKQALGQSLTPQQFLGNSSAQDAVFDKIFGGYVSKYGANGAAQAWFGGPGSVGKGGNAADLLGTTGTSYVQKFNTALGNATQSTNVAAQGLGNLGSGFNTFGQNLSSFYPSSPGGGGGGLFSGLFSGLFGGGWNQSIIAGSPQVAGAISSGTWGLWDKGGPTGGTDAQKVAGLVHEKEYVFDAVSTSKIGVPALEAIRRGALRGYSTGGYVSTTPFSFGGASAGASANNNSAPSIQILNQTSTPITGQVEETSDDHGRRQYRLTLSDEMAAAAEQKGGGFGRAMRGRYGLKPKGIVR
jgi:hypothetical protein